MGGGATEADVGTNIGLVTRPSKQLAIFGPARRGHRPSENFKHTRARFTQMFYLFLNYSKLITNSILYRTREQSE